MREVGYFVNAYPSPSHTFIRREILALEALGWRIHRFSIRHAKGLEDPADRSEKTQTAELASWSVVEAAFALLRVLQQPMHLVHGLWVTLKMAWRSEHFIRSLAVFPEAILLLKRLEDKGLRHVHAHFGTNSASVVRIVRLLGGPSFSFTVHGPFELEPPSVWSTADKVRDAAFVVAISKFARAQVMRVTAPANWHRVHVIHTGLVCRQGTDPDDGGFRSRRLVSIGRLAPEKGHLVLLNAAHQLASRGVEFDLSIVGDGPLRSLLEHEVQRLGLSKRVRFTGWLDDKGVSAELRHSRGLILPSFSEGLPVVLLESLYAGRPVIATQIGGISELVEEAVTGWMVPPGDEKALAKAMVTLLQMPNAVLSEMGRTCRAVVASRHDVEKEAKKLSILFAECLGASGN